MSSVASLRLSAEPLRSLAFGSIGAAYMGIGTAISNPARAIFLQNLTDATLLFSFDGVTEHLILPSNGFFLFDITSNKTSEIGFFADKGQRFYVKQSGVATSGAVYLSTFYGLV